MPKKSIVLCYRRRDFPYHCRISELSRSSLCTDNNIAQLWKGVSALRQVAVLVYDMSRSICARSQSCDTRLEDLSKRSVQSINRTLSEFCQERPFEYSSSQKSPGSLGSSLALQATIFLRRPTFMMGKERATDC